MLCFQNHFNHREEPWGELDEVGADVADPVGPVEHARVAACDLGYELIRLALTNVARHLLVDDAPSGGPSGDQGPEAHRQLQERGVSLRPVPLCDCLAAGDYTHVVGLPGSDPNGPRSGWDFTESVLGTARAGRATRTLRADACGLRVSRRGETGCAGATFDELADCLVGRSVDALYGYDPRLC